MISGKDILNIMVLATGAAILAFVVANPAGTNSIVGKIRGIWNWAMSNALGKS